MNYLQFGIMQRFTQDRSLKGSLVGRKEVVTLGERAWFVGRIFSFMHAASSL
jgi:hypothetical protein